MRRMELEIGRLCVETEAEQAHLQGLPERLQEAFAILARKIQASPAGRRGALRDMVLEQLTLNPRSADQILGPGGAESLADELYVQLVRGI